MSCEYWCDIHLIDSEPPEEGYLVQVQMPGFTLTCNARNLDFSKAICNFVAETRANPQYRDIPLGNGHYRSMPLKIVHVSSSFVDVSMTLQKDGEFDDRYILRIQHDSSLGVMIVLQGTLLDAFLSELATI